METQKATTDDLAAELSRLKKDLDVQKEIAALRMEVKLQMSYFKWVGWSVALVVTISGFLGFRAWNDLTTSARSLYEKQLGEMQDRYSNLSRGFSLTDSGRTLDAVPYLLPLYESNRYDEPVLRALFYALIENNDCEEGLRRLNEVRQDDARFMRIKDAQIFSQAGTLLRNCSMDNAQALEDARRWFELSLRRSNADDPQRRYPLYGLFTYYFISHDLKTAERYLQEAFSIQAFVGPPVEEPWAKRLFERKDKIAEELVPLWTRVAKDKKTP